ncbi:ribbon-helix-helix protein, CopG family (plasmid) [Anabaena sp. FACHB-709]|uniref:ribbon-helix-helix protein, CopG family n=1 Tax=Nostocaceae TaxID=1162 RepID=UPI00000CCDFB|nr:ribbon-helix-helix protein, CopG family [Nostoc sp. PCC 7120 = FACHB-418]RUR72242.1 hypothetical protein DSM107007_57920 [Nostoc sp. PCC 7120 = FACHB-418]BAB77519.1 asl9502 [Nostoc sp. PCC 7120 = FACHB-418]
MAVSIEKRVMPSKKPRLSVVIDQETINQLDEVAKKYDRSRSYMIALAIKKLIEGEQQNIA